MNTEKRREKVFRFVILVPHRDTEKILGEYRKKLFGSGFPGAYSFPAAAPLAQVSVPLRREELKELARNLRELSERKGGKITAAGTAFVSSPEGMVFFGPVLDIPVEENVFSGVMKGKIIRCLFPPVLCAAVTLPGEERVSPGKEPALSFGAAALANLALRRIAGGANGYSFEWRMGPPVWLPARSSKGKV